MNLADLPSLLLWVLGFPALLHVAAALRVRHLSQDAAWEFGGLCSRLSLGVALLALLAYAVVRGGGVALPWLDGSWTLLGLWGWLRFDSIGLLMLALVNFLGVIILRYSRQYLAGDTGQRRFQQSFHGTLASVSLLVISNHLLLIGCLWLLTSLWVHRLLVFYPNRSQAVLAAHKKFLLGRFADASFGVAVWVLYFQTGSFRLDVISASIAEGGTALNGPMVFASLAVVLAVVIKCAQLPFHGWLIQVMEAPTPVSALLHAGVVNLGGFLLLRLTVLLSASEPAQWMLVLIGGGTAMLAGIVMMTQSSVKLSLAWSTCAQMGFMLLECGVGAYSLALLHLMAHSLYKAHAFLSSGRTVVRVRSATLSPLPQNRSLRAAVFAPLVAGGVLLAGMWMWRIDLNLEPQFALAGLILALGTSLLLRDAVSTRGWASLWTALWQVPLIVTVYFVWHALFLGLTAGDVPHSHPAPGLLLVLTIGFGVQYGLMSWVHLFPQHSGVRRLYPWFAAGCFLDEWFTRWTLRWWPPETMPATHREHHRKLGELELLNAG